MVFRGKFKAKDIKGKEVDFTKYKGSPVLIVNVASQCGYTGQYKNIENLNKEYSSKGLKIIGFPSNDFGGQEPGSDSEIAEFCKNNLLFWYSVFVFFWYDVKNICER